MATLLTVNLRDITCVTSFITKCDLFSTFVRALTNYVSRPLYLKETDPYGGYNDVVTIVTVLHNSRVGTCSVALLSSAVLTQGTIGGFVICECAYDNKGSMGTWGIQDHSPFFGGIVDSYISFFYKGAKLGYFTHRRWYFDKSLTDFFRGLGLSTTFGRCRIGPPVLWEQIQLYPRPLPNPRRSRTYQTSCEGLWRTPSSHNVLWTLPRPFPIRHLCTRWIHHHGRHGHLPFSTFCGTNSEGLRALGVHNSQAFLQ